MNTLAVVDDAISRISEKFVNTVSQYKWSLIPETQLHAAKKALMKSDYMMKIAASSPEAVQDALVQSAILGLDLTEGKRQGWLLPRKAQNGKTVIQLQVGYKGVEAIHQRMGVIDRLVIRVVRENDSFEWSGDDQEKPVHNADWFATEEIRGQITGAYAITYYPDGSLNVTVTAISYIFEKHRDRSESYKSYKKKKDAGQSAYPPPWVSDEQSMIEKTMAYIAAKQWPANIRDEGTASKILETLHETDVSDYAYEYTSGQRDAFFNFIENKDALGMYLFAKRVDIGVYSALTKALKNTIPRGGKIARAQEQDDFKESGHDIFFHLTQALDDDDKGLVLECIEGVTDVTLKLIRKELSDEQLDKFEKVNDTDRD